MYNWQRLHEEIIWNFGKLPNPEVILIIFQNQETLVKFSILRNELEKLTKDRKQKPHKVLENITNKTTY